MWSFLTRLSGFAGLLRVNRLCVPLCTALIPIEGGTYASANNKPLISGVLFYQEVFRDGGLPNEWKARVSVHELGHVFGLQDRKSSIGDDGIMFYSVPHGAAQMNYFWRRVDAAAIRKTLRPY
ncbi:MAG: hypothetical protein IKH04_02740 [Kiritimatiellae bacterium]|nr:hypothetical protein [Kiritimatiellia bacterium]